MLAAWLLVPAVDVHVPPEPATFFNELLRQSMQPAVMTDRACNLQS